MQGKELVGIFTERDVVRLTAKAIDLQRVKMTEVMVSPVITLPEKSLQDIFAALFLFRRYRIRHLPIVDDRGELVGTISHESIRHALRPANLLRFRRVSDVMTQQIVHAPPTASVLQVAQLMAGHRVSCIVITQLDAEENPQPIGIVTERDIVQFQSCQINLSKTQAQAVMSTPLFLLSPEDSLWIAHQEMLKRRVGRLVVYWNWGRGLGIVTQTNLLRVFDPMEMYGVIENLQQTIQQLEGETAKKTRWHDEEESDRTISSIPLDRPSWQASLNSLRHSVQQAIDYFDLSIPLQRSDLLSILAAIEQLERASKV
jgi:CBS domain-containing protein